LSFRPGANIENDVHLPPIQRATPLRNEGVARKWKFSGLAAAVDNAIGSLKLRGGVVNRPVVLTYD
jgi:hypothetical protein